MQVSDFGGHGAVEFSKFCGQFMHWWQTVAASILLTAKILFHEIIRFYFLFSEKLVT